MDIFSVRIESSLRDMLWILWVLCPRESRALVISVGICNHYSQMLRIGEKRSPKNNKTRPNEGFQVLSNNDSEL